MTQSLKTIVMTGGIALSLAAGVAVADDVVIVTGDDYKPFTDRSLPNGGFATDLVTEIYTSVGHSVQFVWLPWKRGQNLTEAGEYLATMPWTITDERDETFDFSKPLFELIERLFVKSGTTIAAAEDLDGKRVCLPLGYGQFGVLDAMIQSGATQRQSPKDMESCFQLLWAGRVHAVSATALQGWDQVNALRPDIRSQIEIADLVVSESQMAMMFSEQHPETAWRIEEFNQGLKQVIDDGTYQALLEKHGLAEALSAPDLGD